MRRWRGALGGEDATEDEAEAVDVGVVVLVVVLVVLHGGGVGGLGGVVRHELEWDIYLRRASGRPGAERGGNEMVEEGRE